MELYVKSFIVNCSGCRNLESHNCGKCAYIDYKNKMRNLIESLDPEHIEFKQKHQEKRLGIKRDSHNGVIDYSSIDPMHMPRDEVRTYIGNGSYIRTFKTRHAGTDFY